MKSSNILIGVLLLLIIIVLGYLFTQDNKTTVITEPAPVAETTPVEEIPGTPEPEIITETDDMTRGDQSVIGTSVAGEDIVAYHFGNGEKEVLLLSGIHGGYSLSSAALGYELVDYFRTNEASVPAAVTLTIIPVANPDGLASVTGGTGAFDLAAASKAPEATLIDGRFNTNDVDLNRNFDCEWSEQGQWRSQTVSGGTAPFSEPEAAAIRDYVQTYDPAAAVVWFSAEGKVYPSACADTPTDASAVLAATFATAANYPTEAEFDAYAITGDMVNWMADQDVPAISVLLSSHANTEFDKNRAGVEAILATF